MYLMRSWAVPALVPGAPVDHTWATDFDHVGAPYPSIEDVIIASVNFWFCWGDFRPTGLLLGSRAFDPKLAVFLVEPNIKSHDSDAAKGTIFKYGINGVCHQLTNQALFATRISTTEALTVAGARGYIASSFLYGTYGVPLQPWVKKVQSYAKIRQEGYDKMADSNKDLTKGFAGPMVSPGALEVSDLPDDFASHARTVLRDSPEILARLLALREETLDLVSKDALGDPDPSPESLNARNQSLLDRAVNLLGDEKFFEVFGFWGNQKINLVTNDQKSD